MTQSKSLPKKRSAEENSNRQIVLKVVRIRENL
jgi:hypothetical protein